MAFITPLSAITPSTGPTQAKSLNINGPIGNPTDIVNNCVLQAKTMVQELTLAARMMDSADPNLTAVNNAITALA